jgi:hypothetical protein
VALTAVRAGVQLVPIQRADRSRVSEFLSANLNASVDWARALRVPWEVEQPDHGLMLIERDAVVGVQLAFYSERVIDGSTERFCNLGALCVLPPYRVHALRLLKAALADDDLHFTDLSPSGNVGVLNERLGFRWLDTETSVMPNLPWPSLSRRQRVISDLAYIERTLEGRELEIFLDHAGAAAARHVLLEHGEDHCHVIFRRDRRRGRPWMGSVLYVSRPAVFRRMIRPFGGHLFVHHRLPVTLLEDRVMGGRPRGALRLRWRRRRMYRSPHLGPSHIDYLYSELVCVPWGPR